MYMHKDFFPQSCIYLPKQVDLVHCNKSTKDNFYLMNYYMKVLKKTQLSYYFLETSSLLNGTRTT